ncbi:MAG: hypothetical protein A2Z91_05755 [Deltaproteobacteria bacterium GWA2_38_16]|nr:MAG: hypothetical protein A2Z91_05755 [Deltaproteobacteria bacterium GWA2_38_16]OGQ02617.1 MAG: hypothetical protein A3D19_05050 [Deltaproteobacteria bacterium RIFCSPHIGHO2_02_FULL_38_15]OGQ34770.1 MAG: hypothetical protein A3A72_05215 [Deltaproteobacteria bacterium RIFCSPLOWO2_01_FULL_38_9]OGQ61535.1 MAG: hypothetical protein A3G92_00050 [Deltaproteobacteria bacterium RIFCSPLOWO2_12_FULL_38_8]HBQ20316.1 hypothetical protein [Deltaproteobacteria bacterium]
MAFFMGGNMRNINRLLCFVLFLLLVYLYSPISFGQGTEPEPPITNPDLEAQIRKAVQEALDEQLPAQVEQEVQRRLPGAIARKLADKKKEEEDKQERWLERNQDLRGRYMVNSIGSDGAYGVKFDINPGMNSRSSGGTDRMSVYYAKITPFVRVSGWGSEISLNVRKFLEDEVVKGELRDQVSKLDFESAYIYYRPINKDQVEVKVYLGQVQEPFLHEVVEASVFSNKSILDKYKLNTSMAIRADIGLGHMDPPNPNPDIIERQVWVQAASFNLDKDNGGMDDFAVRVLMSLSVLNRFKVFNFKPIDLWGGFARIGSGKSTAGETDAVTDPTLTQEMSVFGMKIDLNLLTGQELGEIFTEFVRRRKTGDITDQSWVVGWTKKIKPSDPEPEPGKKLKPARPIEIGARFQSQQDDPQIALSDGSVFSVGLLYPLVDYSVALKLNLGYVLESSDPDRDGEIIFTTDFEVIW